MFDFDSLQCSPATYVREAVPLALLLFIAVAETNSRFAERTKLIERKSNKTKQATI